MTSKHLEIARHVLARPGDHSHEARILADEVVYTEALMVELESLLPKLRSRAAVPSPAADLSARQDGAE